MVQNIANAYHSLRSEEILDLSSPELHNKMEEFKEKALILLELLDSSLPAVNRLKVGSVLKLMSHKVIFFPEDAGYSPHPAVG